VQDRSVNSARIGQDSQLLQGLERIGMSFLEGLARLVNFARQGTVCLVWVGLGRLVISDGLGNVGYVEFC